MSMENQPPSKQCGSSPAKQPVHGGMVRPGQADSLSGPERRAVFKARAAALAKTAPKALEGQKVLDIIEFSLAGEHYGVELEAVREVQPLKDFTPLPGAPPFVLGIINLRGEIISVVDLKKFFSLPERGLGELNKVIVIRNREMEFGILADVVMGTRKIIMDDLNPAPLTVTGIGAEYLRGVTLDRLVVIDAQRILKDDEILVQQEAD